MSNKIIKSVSFNITNSDDVKALQHVEGINFAGYVKKLILEDIKANEPNKSFEEMFSDVIRINLNGAEIKF